MLSTEQYKQDLESLSKEQLIERVLILNELCALGMNQLNLNSEKTNG